MIETVLFKRRFRRIKVSRSHCKILFPDVKSQWKKQLTVYYRDFDGRVAVIVSDTFWAGLFGNVQGCPITFQVDSSKFNSTQMSILLQVTHEKFR